MIDYVKILVKGCNPKKLEDNPLLNFYDNINLTTGEIKTFNRKGEKITPFKNAMFKDLEFKIYETGTITIAGSLHKYKNLGGHNYDDFSSDAFKAVLKDLEQKFDIQPRQCILKGLEIGINIIPPIPTNKILQQCFLHSTTQLEFPIRSNQGRYLQAEHSQYIIKLYNKSLQYKKFNPKTEIMRFEIKYKKMPKINAKGIYTLEDLEKYDLQGFRNDLIAEWENILYFDTTINHKTTLLNKFNNLNYWIDLLENKSRSFYYKQRNKLTELTLNNSENIQKQISEIMSAKIDFLTGKGARIDSLYIESTSTPRHQPIEADKESTCLVTGINISMQKKRSELLSHTGLKYYHKTNKKIFDEVKRKYLSELWQNADHKTQIREIAKNIRHTKTNRERKQVKLYPPGQPLLFELQAYNSLFTV
ncbi:MAG: hypothetical protein ACQEWD_00735 [Bacteroidota bacterium]